MHESGESNARLERPNMRTLLHKKPLAGRALGVSEVRKPGAGLGPTRSR